MPLLALATIGSIPACTGNPCQRADPAAPSTVYPRVYGESFRNPYQKYLREGLSPRVRGIPSSLKKVFGNLRSIPACTGNPCLRTAVAAPVAVYPRVYGESLAG